MENKLFDIIVLWAALCCVNSFVLGNEIGIQSAIVLLALSAASYCFMRYVSYRFAVKSAENEVIAEAKKRKIQHYMNVKKRIEDKERVAKTGERNSQKFRLNGGEGIKGFYIASDGSILESKGQLKDRENEIKKES